MYRLVATIATSIVRFVSTMFVDAAKLAPVTKFSAVFAVRCPRWDARGLLTVSCRLDCIPVTRLHPDD